ncbi:MAG: V-type ATPase subunit [Candidatus Altiarchaeia archaeon]
MGLKSAFSDLNRPINYAYPNTRVKAWKSFMLKDEDIRALASSKNLEEYVGLLEHTSYKNEISKISSMEINAIEDLALSNYMRLGETARRVAPKNASPFFDALLLTHEVMLLKRILNKLEEGIEGKNLNIDYSLFSANIGADAKRIIKGLPDTKTKADAMELFRNTKYDFLLRVSSEEMKIPGYAQSLLDMYYLKTLWESIGTLSSKDAAIASKLIGAEIDTINIIVLMRAKQGGYKAEKFLVPASYKLGDKLKELAGKDVSEIVSALSATPYKYALSEAVKSYEKDGSLQSFETGFKKYLMKEYRNAFKNSMFTLGVLLGFIRIKEYELRNLRSIAVAVNNGLDPKDIMELVIE